MTLQQEKIFQALYKNTHFCEINLTSKILHRHQNLKEENTRNTWRRYNIFNINKISIYVCICTHTFNNLQISDKNKNNSRGKYS